MDALALNLTIQIPVLIGTAGLWFQAKKRRIAPALGFISEFAYLAWAVSFSLWGFIPWSLLWMVLYGRTWLHWHERRGS